MVSMVGARRRSTGLVRPGRPARGWPLCWGISLAVSWMATGYAAALSGGEPTPGEPELRKPAPADADARAPTRPLADARRVWVDPVLFGEACKDDTGCPLGYECNEHGDCERSYEARSMGLVGLGILGLGLGVLGFAMAAPVNLLCDPPTSWESRDPQCQTASYVMLGVSAGFLIAGIGLLAHGVQRVPVAVPDLDAGPSANEPAALLDVTPGSLVLRF